MGIVVVVFHRLVFFVGLCVCKEAFAEIDGTAFVFVFVFTVAFDIVEVVEFIGEAQVMDLV